MSHLKSWTQEDIDYLEAHFGKCHVSKIANHLERTEIAVIGKARRLGLTMLTAGGYITLHELSKFLEVNNRTIKRWFEAGLKYRQKAILSKSYYFIDVGEFWSWAKNHKQLIDFSRMERGVLIPEPSWLDEAYKNSQKAAIKRHHVIWRPVEDQFLLSSLKKGDAYETIASALERSVRAVKARYRKLVSEGVAERKRYRLPWTQIEIDMLMDMDKQRLPDKEIAEELGREIHDIRYRRKRLREKGIHNFRKRKSS
ncbi:hypothetical protein [Lysinibacillus antri]|uniref:DNA-binding protein n=1 Tax=Lysinibacillus antri TaxID=2498145 RepID=A0A432LFP5_9BACI|nr:hypothetical protein [Lysinibacillus antri]RUL56480.1 hypothetical protein EK386_02280 [Lysinibacillus antri]